MRRCLVDRSRLFARWCMQGHAKLRSNIYSWDPSGRVHFVAAKKLRWGKRFILFLSGYYEEVQDDQKNCKTSCRRKDDATSQNHLVIGPPIIATDTASRVKLGLTISTFTEINFAGRPSLLRSGGSKRYPLLPSKCTPPWPMSLDTVRSTISRKHQNFDPDAKFSLF